MVRSHHKGCTSLLQLTLPFLQSHLHCQFPVADVVIPVHRCQAPWEGATGVELLIQCRSFGQNSPTPISEASTSTTTWRLEGRFWGWYPQERNLIRGEGCEGQQQHCSVHTSDTNLQTPENVAATYGMKGKWPGDNSRVLCWIIWMLPWVMTYLKKTDAARNWHFSAFIFLLSSWGAAAELTVLYTWDFEKIRLSSK